MNEIFDNQILEHTYIGSFAKLKGSFTFGGDTKIAGNLEGEIKMIESHSLSIEPSANVNAQIDCATVYIYGNLTGAINSSAKVIIYQGATFTGEIHCSELIIRPGAQVNMTGLAQAPNQEV